MTIFKTTCSWVSVSISDIKHTLLFAKTFRLNLKNFLGILSQSILQKHISKDNLCTFVMMRLIFGSGACIYCHEIEHIIKPLERSQQLLLYFAHIIIINQVSPSSTFVICFIVLGVYINSTLCLIKTIAYLCKTLMELNHLLNPLAEKDGGSDTMKSEM